MTITSTIYRPTVAVISPNAGVVKGQLHRANGSTWVRLAEKTRDSLCRQIRYDFIDAELGWKAAAYPYDVILVQRNAVGEHDALRLVEKCRELGKPLILEIDDDLIEKSRESDEEYSGSGSAIEILARNSDLLIVSTNVLKDRYSILNTNILVEGNYISERLWLVPLVNEDTVMPDGIERCSDTEVRAVYMGSVTHGRDLELLREPCENLRQMLPNFRLFVIGATKSSAEWYERVTIPASKKIYPEFVTWLRPILSTMDFSVAPLEDTFFNAAKSDLKFIEYAAAGLACVASSVLPYSDAIVHGETGLLAANTSESWFEQILFAAMNRTAMAEMSRKVHGMVLKERLARDREAVLDETILKLIAQKSR